MESIIDYRPTRAIVDLDAIRANVTNLQRVLPDKTGIIAVVKADGYGHGAVKTAKAAFQAGAIMASVATPDEAIRLRESGVEKPILVMGATPTMFLKEAIRQQITVTVPGIQWARDAVEELSEMEETLKVHVKIDTGMGRLGVRNKQELTELLCILEECSAIEIEGVFTHFARADEQDPAYTKQQFNTFNEIISCFPQRPSLVHASNSAAALRFPEYSLDAVRFGISMYGISPSESIANVQPIELQKALRLQTEVAYIKQTETEEPISYASTYTAHPGEWIATLPVGFADGLKRGLRNQKVLIRGRRMPIVGRICMDQCLVSLSEQVPEGEPVVLIGKQGTEEITMDDWAAAFGTISYEITVTIGGRVPRYYIGER